VFTYCHFLNKPIV